MNSTSTTPPGVDPRSPRTNHYRGYAVTFTDRGADIWFGSEFIETVTDQTVWEGTTPRADRPTKHFAQATRVIDDYLEAR
jgi:hypothetical protein